jgi:putative addiction module antidote
MQIKIRRVGNSLGVILPRDVIANLRVSEGDHLALTEAADGYRISAYDPAIEQQVERARNVMRRYRNALRELAK